MTQDAMQQVKHVLATWQPFLHPEFAVDFFFEWRSLLDATAAAATTKQTKKETKKMTAYEMLMYTVWLPPVQQAFTYFYLFFCLLF